MEEQRFVMLSDRLISYWIIRKPVKGIIMRIKKDGIICISANRQISISQIENFIQKKEGWIMHHLQALSYDQTAVQQPVNWTDFQVLLWGQWQPISLRTSRHTGDKSTAFDLIPEPVLFLPPNFSDSDLEILKEPQNTAKLLLPAANKLISEIYDDAAIHFLKGVADASCFKDLPSLRIKPMKSRWGSCSLKTNTISLNAVLLHLPRPCLIYVIYHELCHLLVPNHSPKFHELVARFFPDEKAVRAEMKQYAPLLGWPGWK